MVEIRFIEEHELADFTVADARGFGMTVPDDQQADAANRLRLTGALDQTMAAFDGGQMVATFSSYPLEIMVPGSRRIPVAGTTWVSVHTTHRRQGILRKMMTRHLQQAIEQGKTAAALWASQEAIYRRYGYGWATQFQRLAFDARRVAQRPELIADGAEIHLRMVDRDQLVTAAPPIYDATLGRVPGALARSGTWWRTGILYDAPEFRRDRGELRGIVARVPSREHPAHHRDVGYVIVRQKPAWDDRSVAQGTTNIVELAAENDQVRRRLWHAVTGFELQPKVVYEMAPIDEPLGYEVAEPRSITRNPCDGLWLRLLDVNHALSQRRYGAEGRILIEVEDRFLNRGGRFELDVVDGQGHCRAADSAAAPDVEVSIADLGSLYLGACTATQLQRAGGVRGSAENIALLHRLFATRQAPYCPETF